MLASPTRRSVLVWHVHGSWMESFVSGRHRYVIPVDQDRPERARGLLGRRWDHAIEVTAATLRDEDIDLVVLQRPEELELTEHWLGRRPGVDVPAVYVEHNAPRPYAVDSVHPLAHRSDIPVVHVTDFNRLMWDNGSAPTRVITHGMADPGLQFSGELPRAATMINEPVRRWRTVGADLLGDLAAGAPIDAWGIASGELARRYPAELVHGHGDVPWPELGRQVARRRVYLHTARWTSLGMSLVEAMFLGMPVVAVATTMAPLVVPPEAGVVSADVETLANALKGYVDDLPAARAAGKAARDFAMAHFGIERFLLQWDEAIDEQCG
jgi:hypothetical protein